MIGRCKDCLYWESYNKDEGSCCRYPPQVNYRGYTNGDISYDLPKTSYYRKCGEFKEKE